MINSINIRAPINTLGYGCVGRNVTFNLSQRLDHVALFPIGPIELSYPNDVKWLQPLISNQEDYDSKAPSLTIWHQHALAEHIGKGPQCALPIFELDRLRPNERHHLSNQDIVFVTSKWHKKILLNVPEIAEDVTVRVVPLGVDTEIFQPVKDIQPNFWTTFLNVGKWEYRKGHDVLIEAFNKAFTPKDRVRLWMSCHNYFLEPKANKGIDGNAEWQRMYQTGPLRHKIHFLPRVIYHSNMAQIMQEVDCGIFPSRAEGWNLELLEMMACGKEVIATNYSGHTEFVNDDNCRLIDIEETEEAYDGKWFFGDGGNWARFGEHQIDQLVDHMRQIHKIKQAENAASIFNEAGVETARKYTWNHTVNCILSVFGDSNE